MNTEAQVLQIESICGAQLPTALRQFLLQSAEIAGNAVRDTNGDFAYINHVESAAEILESYSLIPDDVLSRSLVPFASDGGGNLFCVSTEPSTFGAVYFLDFERATTEPSFMTLVANSFEEFLSAVVTVN